MSKLRSLLIVGTRPEAIKMASVIQECRRRDDVMESIVCLTGQHQEMLDPVIEYFRIREDVRLELMTPNQTLTQLASRCMQEVDKVLLRFKPDCVVAQGDTTTVMATSLAAFHRRIPFVHVEAGLRTGNLMAPWPEEMNRRIASIAAALHCAPTQRAADALLAEGVSSEAVQVTGNTVIDALLETLRRERGNAERWQQRYPTLKDRRMILVTGHRRESFGEGFVNICRALSTLADRFPECQLVYPVHLNPNVSRPVRKLLGGVKNIQLVPPVPYPEFVWLMDRSTVILTDSGGVQEESPSLGKPVLVMRETTERPEAVEAGAARLVGTSVKAIVEGASILLTNPAEYAACQIESNPYGDGHAAERIVDLMLKQNWC